MKYGAIFIFFAAFLLGGCLFVETFIARLFFAYVAFSFLACGIAYLLKSPRFWQKRNDGTISLTSYLLYGPMHGLNWFSLLLAMRLQKEQAFHEITHNLWLGRRLISKEADFFAQKSEVAILDLTSEFSENRLLRNKNYLCLSTLDHTAPSQKQIRRALEFIKNHISQRAVFVHCALGHGRSATVVAAWLLEQSKGQTIEAAVEEIKTIRSGVSLDGHQIAALSELFHSR